MVDYSLSLLPQVLIVCLLSLFISGTALADPPIPAVNTESGLAIKGYDPVSYFTTGQPTPGSPQFSTIYKGPPIGSYRLRTATGS